MAPPIGPNPGGGPGGEGGGGQTTGCDCGNVAYELGHPCFKQCKGSGGGAAPGACPPGQEMINGKCRYPGDFPCPPGQCKDAVTGVCRTVGKAEKVRESDAFDVRGLCKQTGGGGGGGGMGGAGGGGGAAAPKIPGTGPTPGMTDWFNKLLGIGTGENEPGGLLAKKLMDLLNQGTRFTPEVMENLKASAKARTDIGTQRNIEAARADQARSGMLTSGFGAEQIAAERRAGTQALGQQVRDLEIEKVKADFDDRLQGIKAAQGWLDSLRQHAATLDQTLADREKTAATIALGYAQIAAQKEMLIKQLASNEKLLGMQLNSAEWLAIMRMQMGLI